MEVIEKIDSFLDLEVKINPLFLENKSVSLNVFGEIWEQSLFDISQNIKESEGKDLEFIINSGGGSVFDGIAIASMIKMYEGKTISTGVGFVASIASVIMLAADKVQMQRDAFLMIHNASVGFTYGESEDLRKDANLLDKISDQIANIYVAQIAKNGKLIDGSQQKTKNKVKKLMDQETWFNSSQALEIGLIDSVLENDTGSDILSKEEIKNFINKFGGKAPKQFLNKFNPKMETDENKTSIWDQIKALFKTDPERLKALQLEVENESKEADSISLENAKKLINDAGFVILTEEKADEINNSYLIEKVKFEEEKESHDLLKIEFENCLEKLKTLENSVNGPSSKPVLENSDRKKISTKETILNKIASESKLSETQFFKNLNS